MSTLDLMQRFSDTAEISQMAAAQGWQLSYTRLGPGDLGVSAWASNVGDFLLYRERFEFPMVGHGQSATHAFSVVTVQKGVLRLNGEEITPERLGLFPPGAKVDASGETEYEAFHVQVSASRLLAAAREAGVELFGASRAFGIIPGFDRIRQLTRVMQEASEVLASNDSAAWAKIEGDLLALLVAVFDKTTVERLRIRDSLTPGTAHALEIRQRIDSQLPEELDLNQLARDLGISRRHLNRCFKANYGASPREYVHVRRLHEARRLLQTRAQGVSVTEAAHASGFTHLGRFSTNYKRLFGESPRQTLHQPTLPD